MKGTQLPCKSQNGDILVTIPCTNEEGDNLLAAKGLLLFKSQVLRNCVLFLNDDTCLRISQTKTLFLLSTAMGKERKV